MTAIVQISKHGFTPYGGAETFMYSQVPEVIISGPYDTGKTITALTKLHLLLCKYDKSRALMVRKTYKSLTESAVVTYEKRVLPAEPKDPKCPVSKFGGEKPQWYDYPNGSRLVCAGLDNPGKTLSAEYDFIYVNQAEELVEDDWQALTRAASGRSGNSPYTQVMGDCNPDVPGHWILKRDRLLVIKSSHADNPTIFDQDTGKCIAPERIETLKAMTGVRYKRGYLGLWVGREGQVYEFDNSVHLIDRFDIPKSWLRYRAIDFGYTNPFVCQWWAEDEDGRLYLYREIYMSQRTVRDHANQINRLSKGESYVITVADHDAEDRATLGQSGIYTKAADKRVSVGIQTVAERLKVAGDGRPRLFVLRDSLVETDRVMESKSNPTCTVDEFPGYVWPTTKAQRAADERPVKTDDHGMDALRYMIMYCDSGAALPFVT